MLSTDRIVLSVLVLILTAGSLGSLGCAGGRIGEDESLVSSSGAGSAAVGLPMTLGVLTELALVLADPEGQAACPAIQQEDDQIAIDFGLACSPDSNLSNSPLSGSATFTVPADSTLVVGSLEGLGFEGLLLTGDLSGDILQSGADLRADISVESLSWSNGTDVALSGLFEIDHSAAGTNLQLSGGVFNYTQNASYEMWTEDLFTPEGSFSPCYLPEAGTVNLLRETVSATWTYTEEAAENGRIRISFSDRGAEDLSPCPQ